MKVLFYILWIPILLTIVGFVWLVFTRPFEVEFD